MKNFLMVAGLALLVGASTACFGLFSRDDDGARRPAVQASCEGLTGQAKIDCENRKQGG
jgi:hypothetical protein